MRGRAEDHAAVGALALEHAARIMQPVGEHVQRGVAPGHEPAVVPDAAVPLVEGLLHGFFLRKPNCSGRRPFDQGNPAEL